MHPIARLGESLLDLVYPEECLGCGRRRGEAPWVPAGPVVDGLRPWDRPHLCSACAEAGAGGPVSGPVGSPASPLEVLAATWSTGSLVSLVGEFKYHGVRGLGWPLARGMVSAVRPGVIRGEPAVLVPIPLHSRRRRSRGFNQAAVLAHLVGKEVGWAVRTDLLTRVRRTGQQAKLDSVEERRANLDGAFRPLARPGGPSGAVVVLVDDLVTSGSTVLAAAGALRSWGWTVAAAVAAGLARRPGQKRPAG